MKLEYFHLPHSCGHMCPAHISHSRELACKICSLKQLAKVKIHHVIVWSGSLKLCDKNIITTVNIESHAYHQVISHHQREIHDWFEISKPLWMETTIYISFKWHQNKAFLAPKASWLTLVTISCCVTSFGSCRSLYHVEPRAHVVDATLLDSLTLISSLWYNLATGLEDLGFG